MLSDLADTVLVVPDTTPLIHLASGGLLDVLTAFGPVIVPDVIAIQATRRPDKPWATEVAAWLDRAVAAGHVRIVETDVGALYKQFVEARGRRIRNAGELSIIEWLRDELNEDGPTTLVVFEDDRVPGMVA